MIVVSAVMWPQGSQATSYEILNATLTNKSSPGDATESYFAHVLARPKPFDGIPGYEADIEVTGHQYRDGFAPLLMSVLNAAHMSEEPFAENRVLMPPSRQLSRISVVDATAFEEILRKGFV